MTCSNKTAPKEAADLSGVYLMMKRFSDLKLKNKILLGNIVAMGLLIVFAVAVYFSINTLMETSRWVAHTEKVISMGHELTEELLNLETGERGYLITGKDEFLEPYQSALIGFEGKLNRTLDLVSDNPAQVRNLKRIEGLVDRWLKEAGAKEILMRKEISVRATEVEEMEALLKEGVGRGIIRQMTAGLDSLDAIFVEAGEKEASSAVRSTVSPLMAQEVFMRDFLVTGAPKSLEASESGRARFDRGLNGLVKIVERGLERDALRRSHGELQGLISEWKNAPVPEVGRSETGAGKLTGSMPGGLSVTGANTATGPFERIREVLTSMKTAFVRSGNEEGARLVAGIGGLVDETRTLGRGPVVSGSAGARALSSKGTDELNNNLSDLKLLIERAYDKTRAEKIIGALSHLSVELRGEAAGGIELRRKIDSRTATRSELINLIAGGQGKRIMDDLRHELSRFISVEEVLNQERQINSLRTARNTIIFISAGSVVAFIIILLIGWWVARSVSAPLMSFVKSADAIRDGEPVYREGRDRVGEDNNALSGFMGFKSGNGVKRAFFARNYVPVLAAAVGVMLSIMAFLIFRNEEFKTVSEDFIRHSEDRFHAIELSVLTSSRELKRLELLFKSSNNIGREEFSVLARHILGDRNVIRTLEWIPSFGGADEGALRGVDTDDVFNGVGEGGGYFPITYIEPFGEYSELLGFNMASDPAIFEVLKKSRDTGEITATPGINKRHNNKETTEFMIFSPIYQSGALPQTVEERRRALKGFVAGSFRVGEMVERSFETFSPKGLNVYLYDLSPSGQLEPLYSHLSRLSGEEDNLGGSGEVSPPHGLEASYAFSVADRMWLLKTRPIEKYFAHFKDWHAWAVLCVGMLFSMLVIFFFKSSVTYAAKVEGYADKLTIEDEKRRYAENTLRSKKDELDLLTEELHSLTIEMSLLEEKERKLLSEKLHEDIGQNLSLIKLNLLTLTNEFDHNDARQRRLFSETEELLKRTITATRSLNSSLYPALPAGTSVADAIRWYAEIFFKKGDISASFSVAEGVESVPFDVRELLLRVTRELFQNIMKHSGAKNVEVIVKTDVEYLEFKVIDDGSGFSPDEMKFKRERGIGLMLMRERVKHMNGVLNIGSRPGKGTTVEVTVPL